MGKIKAHHPVKLLVGLIARERTSFELVSSILAKKFGTIDLKSEIFPFNHTVYYQPEMGKDLLRKFLSFHKLIKPDRADRLKIFTNNVEKRLSQNNKRSVNIDPGYITPGKLVLLTTKNYSHRVYIRSGIYAEVALYFKNGRFQPWSWSYPDYRTDGYGIFFKRVRGLYMEQIK